MPDLTIYMKLSTEDAELRTASNSKDRMEKSGQDFFERVAKGFDELSKEENRFKTVDASRDKSVVHKDIVSHVQELL